MIILFADLMIVSLKWRLLRIDFFFSISSLFQWSLDSDLCSLSISMPCVVGWVIYEITKLHVMNRIQSRATLICMIFHVQSADSYCTCLRTIGRCRCRDRVYACNNIISSFVRICIARSTYQGQRFVFLFFFFFSVHCVAANEHAHFIQLHCAMCILQSIIPNV